MATFKPKLPLFRHHKKKVYAGVSSTAHFIHQVGENQTLRKKSKSVPVNKITSKSFQQKIAYMKKRMREYRKRTGMGRGITGVQLGIPERFSVIYTPDKKLMIIINPKITKRSKKLLRFPEVCMSANPIIAPVVRPSWVEFDYYDEKRKRQKWNVKDTTKAGKIMNRVFQHEIDHMEGIICIDKVSSRDLILESDPKFYKNAKFQEV